ncbi:MAG: hypothetical protein WCP85_06350 [Mariniphaga sp.]
MKHLIFFSFLLCALNSISQPTSNRWAITKEGPIRWEIGDNLPHRDNIEMSGKYISTVIRYGVNADKSFWLSRDIVWPMLRTIPNNTHASLTRTFTTDVVGMISINNRAIQNEQVKEILLDGKITVKSTVGKNMELTRTLFPSTDLPVYIEKYELTNKDTRPAKVEIPDVKTVVSTLPEDGTEGSYKLSLVTLNAGVCQLKPGESKVFYLVIRGEKLGQDYSSVNVENELSKRVTLLKELSEKLILETPDEVLNRAFAFAKIRASESIYQTKGGPMHGPGGLSYYAAIWANDQAEYVSPFFPYLGYEYGIESGMNAYRHFARFMNPEFKPIPSSIIAEGIDIWNGAGDRGDAAMIAYGAARFALSLGDKAKAEELWKLVEWCLEYNKRKLNPQGVVASKSDELEGRFPSGTANLCTSSLYYDALVSASYLAKSLGKTNKLSSGYLSQAADLKKNIEKYFGAKVMGFDTYQYYEGNDKLRAWICIPLTVNLLDRKVGTLNALFSKGLWTTDGLATQSGETTFWDRATLYGLRGAFAAGETKRGLEFLKYYSERRLLGEHVPYPVEAFPEGNQRHLSAESGLYCRIYTEGLFGIRPTGLNQFTITPQMPDGWKVMKLRNIHGFQHTYDIEVERVESKIHVKVKTENGIVFDQTVANGISCNVKML